MKLYEIVEAMSKVQEMLDEGMDVKDTLDALQISFDEKVENICRLIRMYEADAEMFKAEAKRLQDKAKSAENKAEWLRGYLLDNLKRLGVKKIKAGIFTASVRATKPSVVIEDEALIPDWAKIPQPPKIDKNVIYEAIQSGNTVPGAKLQENETLSIR